jgi:hypothetical protein
VRSTASIVDDASMRDPIALWSRPAVAAAENEETDGSVQMPLSHVGGASATADSAS